MRRWSLLFLLTFVSISSFAQHHIQGKILDKKNDGGIEMATIRLLNAKDSALVQSCQTDNKGGFTLSKVKDGNYIVETRFLGYNRAYRDVTITGKSVLLKNILLEENSKILKEVEVRGLTAQMSVKGDTIEYNPAAIKTQENAVLEDLLKKLPGVKVDANGKITVNGEAITQIRIDGKKFFTGNVQMATKNVPVDMIEKVQVLNQKSDIAKLTGFEDRNTEKIINLTTKPNRKKGLFGNVSLGGGADVDKASRYEDNAFVNFMNGESRTAIIARANKTRDGGSMTTQNIGVNNNSDISKRLKVNGDGSLNHFNSFYQASSERQSWTTGNTFDNKDARTSNMDNKEASMRLEMEWNIDSLNTLIVQPNISYTNGVSSSNDDFTYYGKEGNSDTNNFSSFTDSDRISWGNTNNSNENNTINAGINLIYNHKSKTKQGRIITLNVGGSLNNSNGDEQNYSKKITVDSTSIIDQHTNNTAQSYSANINISYVEPIWNQKNFLQATASMNFNTRSSDKMQYNKENTDNKDRYNLLDSTYSNSFENNFYNESVALNFRHQETNYNYMLGLRTEPSQTYSTTDYLNGNILSRNNEVINMAPTASFTYHFGRKKFVYIVYSGQTSQPSIDQMQPVKNNNNLMNESIGNPTLNPSFNQNIHLSYSGFNSDRFSSFSAGLSGNYTKNALVTNSIYDATGKQWSQTVNAVNTPFNTSVYIMFNTPVIKNKLQFNTNMEWGYQQRFGYSSKSVSNAFDSITGDLKLGDLSKTISQNARGSLSLTFTTNVIEIGINGSVRYTDTQNNLNNNINQRTWDWTGTGNVNLHLPHKFNISNDFNYTTRQGYSSYDKNELVWNASIDKSMFKNKVTLALRANDILQQKQNISAGIGDNYRQISHVSTSTSYVMISFTYKITKFGGGTTSTNMFKGR